MARKPKPLPPITTAEGLAIVYRPMDELVPYERNARTHPDEQITAIMASLMEFGWTTPVGHADGQLVYGHARIKAARALREAGKAIPHNPDPAMVPTIDLSHLNPGQRQAYVIADNQLAAIAGWDRELLKMELGSLLDQGFDIDILGFPQFELESLMAPVSPGLTGPDDEPPPPDNPTSRAGDIWQLGRHRIMVADTTDPDAVAALLDGQDIDLIVTSPPYNQKIDGFRQSGMHKGNAWVKRTERLAYSDDMPERDYQAQQRELLGIWYDQMREGASVFYNHKNRYRDKRVVSPYEWLPGPFAFRQEIIWHRPGSMTQNARMFLPTDERIFWLYKGDDFTFNDTTEIKSWSTVWDIKPKQTHDHPVAYPVELPKRCIQAASMPDDLVFDPYLGSGTTLIAAQMSGRRCCGMELSPSFADVAVIRWQDFTGEKAKLAGTDQTFATIKQERAQQAPEDA